MRQQETLTSEIVFNGETLLVDYKFERLRAQIVGIYSERGCVDLNTMALNVITQEIEHAEKMRVLIDAGNRRHTEFEPDHKIPNSLLRHYLNQVKCVLSLITGCPKNQGSGLRACLSLLHRCRL